MATQSLKLQAYQYIKDKIIQCEYKPNMILNEEFLKEEIGVSRTPIRDALSRLEQEGLIYIMPKKGIMVTGLSVAENNMIFEIRMLYEPYALEHYGHLIPEEVLMRYYDMFKQATDIMTDDEYFLFDDEFHKYLVGLINNKYITSTYERIQNQNFRFRILTAKRTIERLRHGNDEHLDIVKCCIQKNYQGAAEAMRKHLSQSKLATFELLMSDVSNQIF
ncbi:MAG: GntR family transcriptional regulator [Lachnospiraceae bacterium]